MLTLIITAMCMYATALFFCVYGLNSDDDGDDGDDDSDDGDLPHRM